MELRLWTNGFSSQIGNSNNFLELWRLNNISYQ